MKAKFKLGQLVKVSPDCDNENYESFRDQTLRVTHVAKSAADHPGFDSGVNEPLYDLEYANGNVPVPCSLYEYELTYA